MAKVRFPPADVICNTDFVNIFHMQRSSPTVVIGSIFTWDLRMQRMDFGLRGGTSVRLDRFLSHNESLQDCV